MAQEDEATKAKRAKIFAIQSDASLSASEKGRKMQELHTYKTKQHSSASGDSADKENAPDRAAANAQPAPPQSSTLLDESLKCPVCWDLCDRPVTAPCQHNLCLKCLKQNMAHGHKCCPTCRAPYPAKFMANPRINTALTGAIRLAKQGVAVTAPKAIARINDSDRPDEAFTTERAVRSGRANAASGRIMVTIPGDFFGPIGAEYTPQPREGEPAGVFVGMGWKDRLDCRQWGAHFPHVAGIAGQSNVGAQSVVLSGGYEDDRDEGEWFLYTGSGGRDLSGNKRTSKTQSHDQVFEKMNKALKLSCVKGFPVRVVRSAKEKRSAYAPNAEVEAPVRYDGVYRILRCWRKKGAQEQLMCRYLFVRCDNDPAPWTTGDEGDVPRLELPAEALAEIKAADKQQVFSMGSDPYWDYDEETGKWGWAKPQPASRKVVGGGGGDTAKGLRNKVSKHEKQLRELKCGICKELLKAPLSMSCGHNFCKACIISKFEGVPDAVVNAARTMRARKIMKPCPTCKHDIADCLRSAAVNTHMSELIDKLVAEAAEARLAAEKAEQGEALEGALLDSADDEEGDEDQDEEEEEDREEGGSDDDDGDDDDEGPGQQEGPAAVAADAPAVEGAAAAPTAAAEAAEGGGPQAGSADAATSAGSGPAAKGACAAASAAPAPAVAPAAVAPAVVGSAVSRWGAQLAQLVVAFPDYDASLIDCMLEDQGGDLEEVHAQLKRMKNQQAHARRPPPSSNRKAPAKKKAAKGRPSTAKAAAAADGDDAEAAAAAADGDAEGTAAEGAAGDADAGTSAAAEAAAGVQQQQQQEGEEEEEAQVADVMDVDAKEPVAEEAEAAEAAAPKAKRARGGKAAAKAPAPKRGKRGVDKAEQQQQQQEEEADEAGDDSDDDFQAPKGKAGAPKKAAAPTAKKARRGAKN